jgi:GcrA cell cycle regulator
MKNSGSWPPETFERAAEMWRAGKSAEYIACAIGKTRNSVIGKMHRKGVRPPSRPCTGGRVIARNPPAPPPPIAAGSRVRKEPRPPRFFLIGKGPEPSRPKPPAPPAAGLPSEPAPLNVAFADLESGMCKWPSGAGHHRFCGNATGPGGTYCPYHGVAATAKGMAAIKAAAEALKGAAAGARQ